MTFQAFELLDSPEWVGESHGIKVNNWLHTYGERRFFDTMAARDAWVAAGPLFTSGPSHRVGGPRRLIGSQIGCAE